MTNNQLKVIIFTLCGIASVFVTEKIQGDSVNHILKDMLKAVDETC